METLKKFKPYIIILIVVILIRSFIITPAIVNGDSMKDTLLDNEVVLVNKISLRTSGLKRFDVVVIKSSEGTIVKRVIALPGEKVEYKNNVLYINDKKIKTQKFKNTEDFKYILENVKEAQKDGFELLVAFPQINATYENPHLFAVFGARLPDKRRPEIDKILEEYGMTEYDEFELLKRSGAKLPTDNYEFVK